MNKRIKVVCLECGKKFQTASLDPECPRCHGVDIDVREESTRGHITFVSKHTFSPRPKL